MAAGAWQGVSSMVTSQVTAPTAYQLCLPAPRCTALVAAAKTKAQSKKGRLARRKGARRVLKATAVGSGDEEVVPRGALSRTEMVACGVGELPASAPCSRALKLLLMEDKSSKVSPCPGKQRAGDGSQVSSSLRTPSTLGLRRGRTETRQSSSKRQGTCPDHQFPPVSLCDCVVQTKCQHARLAHG